MHRISSDKDYYANGKVAIDADGIPFEPAAKTYVDQRVPIDSFAGTGSPEGTIAAPVGSIYTDTAATNGAIRWVKTNGTGNTGWSVEYGDTGWRNIASLFSHLTSNTSSDRMSIMRSGNIVQLVVHSVAFDKSAVESGSQIFTLPVGFRPGRAFRHPIAAPSINLDLSAATGRVLTYGSTIELGASVSFELSWLTNNPWPATLPGTPA